MSYHTRKTLPLISLVVLTLLGLPQESTTAYRNRSGRHGRHDIALQTAEDGTRLIFDALNNNTGSQETRIRRTKGRRIAGRHRGGKKKRGALRRGAPLIQDSAILSGF